MEPLEKSKHLLKQVETLLTQSCVRYSDFNYENKVTNIVKEIQEFFKDLENPGEFKETLDIVTESDSDMVVGTNAQPKTVHLPVIK